MFKLIKIQNAGVNLPEPIKMSKGNTKINIGSALVLSAGKVTAPAATAKPAYIAMETASSDQSEVLCYEIFPNMLFETTVNASPASLKEGDKVTLGFDGDSCASCVTATTTNGIASIAELLGASAAGDKITVKF